MHDLLVYTLAAAAVVGFFKALYADSRNEVLDAEHFLAEFLIDKGTVREGKEFAVRMHFADLNKVFFAYKRFAAGIYEHVGAKFVGLFDDRIDIFKSQVQLMTIFSSPAAGAAKVACGCRIEKYCPRNIAVVFLSIFLLSMTAAGS